MRIIINVSGFGLMIFTAFLVYLLSFITPQFSNSTHPFSWVVLFVVSGLGEIFNIRGRLFFIPIWLWASFGFIYTSINKFKDAGTIYGPLFLICCFVFAFFIIKKNNKRRWQLAVKSLNDIKQLTKEGMESTLFFESFRKAFFFPNTLLSDNHLIYIILTKYYNDGYIKWFKKPEINTHYINALDLLKNHIGENEYKRYVAVLHSSMKKLQTSKNVYIEPYMFENIIELINNKEKELNQLAKEVFKKYQ